MSHPNTRINSKYKIKSWKQFAKHVRSHDCNLLLKLKEFPDSVLVAGCQRSGTTAIANIITTSEGMTNYWFGKDSELDAALLLSGYALHAGDGRFCFQTTYLNECVEDYFNHVGHYKLIWIVRNPHSVVCSMLYNWGNFAFNELFDSCGSKLLQDKDNRRYKKFGKFVIPKIKRGCLSYNAKTTQILMLRERIPKDDLLIVDYDNLVENSQAKLEIIYNFIDLPFKNDYSDKLKSTSINKYQKFSAKQIKYISDLCLETYKQVQSLAI